MNGPTASLNGSFTGLGLPSNATIYQRISNRPFWSMLSADIFAGQIIASLIVLIFVAIFLLREWISQNARPGVFEDEDGGAIHPAPQPDLPAAAVEEPVNVHIPDENGFAGNALREAALDARRQGRAMRVHRGAGVVQRQGLHQRDPLEMDRHQILRNRPLDKLPFPLESAPQLPQVPREQPPQYEPKHHPRKGKGRAEEPDDIGEGSSDLNSQRRIRRRIHTEEDESMSHETADSQDVQPSTSLNGGEALTFPFTFRASSSINSDFQEPSRGSDPVVGPSTFNGRYPWDADFQIDSQPTSSSVSPPTTPALHVNIGTPLRRPPMANSTIFAEGATPNKLQPSPALPSSPSLAMYLAPEELEAGPSGYFDSGEHSKEELEEELESFFRDPESASPDLPPPSDGQDQASIATIPDTLLEENDEEDDDEGEEEEEEEEDVPAQEPAAEVDRVLDDEDEEDDDGDGDGDDLINPRDDNVAAAPQIQVAFNQPGDMDDIEPGVEDDLDGAMEGLTIFLIARNILIFCSDWIEGTYPRGFSERSSRILMHVSLTNGQNRRSSWSSSLTPRLALVYGFHLSLERQPLYYR
jgi:E3 ubiquitin-protein ligase MARCH6